MHLCQCGSRCALDEAGQVLHRFRAMSESLMKCSWVCVHIRILRFQ